MTLPHHDGPLENINSFWVTEAPCLLCIGLPLHALFFENSDFKTSVIAEYETEWIHFTNNCIEDLESPARSHFLFLLLRINAGKNCILYGVKEIFKNYLDHLEEKDERDFIILMLQEMLFYAVEKLSADAENNIPAKSSFELALEYGFKNTEKRFFTRTRYVCPISCQQSWRC